jgi:hypothetical protein
MGFITDEWISPGVVTGNYAVAKVTFVASRPASEFSKRHGLVLRLEARSAVSNDYQVVHFDSSDLQNFLASSLREVGPQLRAGLVKALLGELSDDEWAWAMGFEATSRRAREATG